MPAPFDLSEIEEPKFDPIAAGKYRMMISEAEWKTFNSGAEGWNLQTKVTAGDCEGRVVFHTVVFPKEGADPEKAQTQLGFIKSFLLGVGYENEELRDFDAEAETEELLNREFIGTVSIQKGTEEYPDPQNRIKKFATLSEEESILP